MHFPQKVKQNKFFFLIVYIALLSVQLYPDQEVATEIMNSLVRCTHYKDGCRWIDRLQNLQVKAKICCVTCNLYLLPILSIDTNI